jgi:hypothetical protein
LDLGASAETGASHRVELLCAAHNALAREHDFGQDFMNKKKGSRSNFV